ncbi:HalOD1 output domain-containing protein [Natrinema halophilum]|uniref:Halobacterial output domain-containing protein n=1 Tax=Natrinema halophilum TaxID=1699371 RepID=A0A7D5GKG5_9EURY|nr:HalOD1 output domain-containing protein [Natrinema halophilum]QLG49170.1 hypothetical protein HYG82_10040 [Natrinema halophilum]
MTGNDSSSTTNSRDDDSAGGFYTVHCDWNSTDSPSSAVVRAVADVTGRDVTAIQPLYEAIDPDALDRFLTHGKASARPRMLSFRFEHCDVTVDAEGRIDIKRLE